MLDKPTSNQSYAQRYAARIDAHLPKLRDDATRKAFLLQERVKYEDDYAYFQNRGVSNFNLAGGQQPTATDYVLTITALTARIAKIGEAGT